MRRKLPLFLLLAALPLALRAQDKPLWTIQPPVASNSTYVYVLEEATDTTRLAAYNQAIGKVLEATALRLGQPFDSKAVHDALAKGEEIPVISRQFNIPINKVCEYVERIEDRFRVENKFKVYVLCQVALKGNEQPRFDSFDQCHNIRPYKNGVALLESAIIPGLGQFGKRHYVEGVLTFLGEAALVSGAIASYGIGENNLDKIHRGTDNFAEHQQLLDGYRAARTVNILCWSAAATLYVVNLYRAFTLIPSIPQSLAFAPSVLTTPDNAVPAFSLAYSF